VNLCFFTFLSLVLYGGLPDFSGFSLLMSIALAVVGALSSLVGILIMKYGKMSVYSVFMMLGGMMLPYFYGLVFLNESISAARVVGLAVLIFALPCSVMNPAGKKEKTNTAQSKFYYILCVCIFLLNGSTSIIAKTHSINASAVPAANFIVYASLWALVINGAAYLIFSLRAKISKENKPEDIKESSESEPNKTRAFLTAAAFAIIGNTGFMFQLISAETVPAVALYPFVTGGTIALSAIGARIFFKEKIGKPALAGIIMSICGTLLFLIQ